MVEDWQIALSFAQKPSKMSKVPQSLDAILAAQRQEKEAESKPVFISKKAREAMKLAEEAKKADEEKIKSEQSAQERAKWQREAQRASFQARSNGPTPSGPQSGNSWNGNGSKYSRDLNQSKNGQTSHSSRDMPPPPPPPSSTSSVKESGLTEAEIMQTKQMYLRTSLPKKRARKMSDKKFNFGWDESDDTSTGVTSLGSVQVRLSATPELEVKRRKLVPSTEQHADELEKRRAKKAGMTEDTHWKDKPLDQMKERDWRIFREDFNIRVRGGSVPNPLRSWAESSIPQEILQIIDTIGYKEPSGIQRQAIPIGLQSRDLIGIAETGSGKTASFVIPMLDYIGRLPRLSDENRHHGPYALIMAPTRELAQQIESEAKKFTAPLGYTCVSIVGGRSVEEQTHNLRNGAELIIATPGRLKDILERGIIVLAQCAYVVMDEADRMVDLGFENDVNYILDAMATALRPGEEDQEGVGQARHSEATRQIKDALVTTDGVVRYRQTFLFSATMPPAVDRIARKYLRKPATVTIGNAGQAVDTVEQRVEFVHTEEKKKNRLLDILNSEQFNPPMIVFVNQKKFADQLAKDLTRGGWACTTMHSGKSQEQREEALNALRRGDSYVLVATDLAGRGIDVPDVSLVVNFQMAKTIEAYVHRIGRTGRAGKHGTAITFLSNEDDEVMFDLKNEISKSGISKMNPELARHEFAQMKITREMKKQAQRAEAEDDG